jgi:hypothetical protein
MPTVFVSHEVKDKDHWLAATTREEFFTPLGVTNIREFVDPTNPARVGVLMDVADMDALAAALETPEAAAAEERDGVVKETLVILVEA